jgi:nucleoside-diphosphate-sugar epimerase
MCLTILGGNGFVGGAYVKAFYDAAIGNIASVNRRDDYAVYSKDVLYFISTVHNYNVFDQPLLDIDTNLTTLVRVLENWRKRPDSAGGVFNFLSSWFVYGPQGFPFGIHEEAHCNPRGFYSITKRCAEQLLISYCETYNLRYRILRLGNVVGPGDAKVSAKKNALQHLINQVVANQPVEVYGDGMFFRDYIHVSDCIRAIDIVLQRGERDAIYNVGNGHKVADSLLSILRYVKEQTGSSSEFKFIPAKKFHKTVQVETFGMDVSKLAALGYAPEYIGTKLYDTLFKEQRNEVR